MISSNANRNTSESRGAALTVSRVERSYAPDEAIGYKRLRGPTADPANLQLMIEKKSAAYCGCPKRLANCRFTWRTLTNFSPNKPPSAAEASDWSICSI